MREVVGGLNIEDQEVGTIAAEYLTSVLTDTFGLPPPIKIQQKQELS